ncbi:hypothetical protein F5Y12DRAFT_675602 [Xylaria sp. FL1777]|nr:hypothetical protein F5Y12DRAFT_675602 [Xylaria sp. FL1777]
MRGVASLILGKDRPRRKCTGFSATEDVIELRKQCLLSSHFEKFSPYPSRLNAKSAVAEQHPEIEKPTTWFESTGFNLPDTERLSSAVTDSVSSFTSSSNESRATSRAFIEIFKEQAIEEITLATTQWLRSQSIRAHNAANEATASSFEGESTSSGRAGQCPENQLPITRKRKLGSTDNDEGHNDDDDGDGDDEKPPRSGATDKKGKGKDIVRFACPYFKYDPIKYQGWPSCPGPGWPDVHRVKEHLYRKHRQDKFRCMRCSECFESKQDYVDHQRASIPCERRDIGLIEGFDAAQEKQLKSRKRQSHVVSELDKWRAVFHILFEEVPKENIPSPFYEYEQLTMPTRPSHEIFDKYEKYLLHEIPLQLRKIGAKSSSSSYRICKDTRTKTAPRV